MTDHGLTPHDDVYARLRVSDTPGRLYFVDGCGHFVKVVAPALDPTTRLRNNTLERETAILRSLEGMTGFPRVAFLEQAPDWQALGTDHIEGARLSETRLPSRRLPLLSMKLAWLLVRLSLRGLSHNDVKAENVVLSSSGSVWLLDFDQATAGHGRFTALVRNFLGSHFTRDGVVVHGSFRTLVRGLSRRRSLARLRRLPPKGAAVTEQQKMLYRAWQLAQQSDANAPGDRVAYYALRVGDLQLPGERPWAERWDVLRGKVDFADKRVLELGCNMGLLSTYLVRFEGAAAALGVDNDATILRSAQLVADAFGVSVQWRRADLADPADVDDLIAFRPDIVTCLNVWHWVDDTTHLARLLARAPELIFEGHESAAVETDRLRSFGFDRVEVVALSERRRPILHAGRERA